MARSETLIPLDLVSLILLRVSPCTLWSARLVCKQWYGLVRSAEFVAERRHATGGAWLATLHDMRPEFVVKAAWILLYNPLLNVEETVSVPISQMWPGLLLGHLFMVESYRKNCVGLLAMLAQEMGSSNMLAQELSRCTWDPVTGLIERVTGLIERDLDSSDSADCLEAFGFMADCRHEFMAAMPSDMWLAMRDMRGMKFPVTQSVVTPDYFLTWSLHHPEESERIALFQPRTGRWRWVHNIWHTPSHLCRWNALDPVVIITSN